LTIHPSPFPIQATGFFEDPILSNEYKGQKPNTPVKANTIAIIRRIVASVPVIVPAAYKEMITIAITNRMIRSIVPIFFFIIFIL
jgi:hypothetical protein